MHDMQEILPFPHYPAFSEEDFLVGTSNEEAYEAVTAWPAWVAPIMALVGPPRSGKTHLSSIWAERAGARQRRLTLETLTLFKDENVPMAIVVEDIDREGVEDVLLFHLINAVKQTGTTCLFTSREPLALLPASTKDLNSRLRSIPSVNITLPDDDLLRNLFLKLFADRQLIPAPDLISYLVSRIERSFEAANDTVEALDRLALKSGRAITKRLAIDYFRDLEG